MVTRCIGSQCTQQARGEPVEASLKVWPLLERSEPDRRLHEIVAGLHRHGTDSCAPRAHRRRRRAGRRCLMAAETLVTLATPGSRTVPSRYQQHRRPLPQRISRVVPTFALWQHVTSWTAPRSSGCSLCRTELSRAFSRTWTHGSLIKPRGSSPRWRGLIPQKTGAGDWTPAVVRFAPTASTGIIRKTS
jgi:hypothetical protein